MCTANVGNLEKCIFLRICAAHFCPNPSVILYQMSIHLLYSLDASVKRETTGCCCYCEQRLLRHFIACWHFVCVPNWILRLIRMVHVNGKTLHLHVFVTCRPHLRHCARTLDSSCVFTLSEIDMRILYTSSIVDTILMSFVVVFSVPAFFCLCFSASLDIRIRYVSVCRILSTISFFFVSLYVTFSINTYTIIILYVEWMFFYKFQ